MKCMSMHWPEGTNKVSHLKFSKLLQWAAASHHCSRLHGLIPRFSSFPSLYKSWWYSKFSLGLNNCDCVFMVFHLWSVFPSCLVFKGFMQRVLWNFMLSCTNQHDHKENIFLNVYSSVVAPYRHESHGELLSVCSVDDSCRLNYVP